jgi:hypothetical protein
VARVPNQPATPGRSIRIPDDLWEAALAKAEERGETVTPVVIAALTRYVRDYDEWPPNRR